MNNKNVKNAKKKKVNKRELALRIACGVLAGIMVLGVAYTVIAVLL